MRGGGYEYVSILALYKSPSLRLLWCGRVKGIGFALSCQHDGMLLWPAGSASGLFRSSPSLHPHLCIEHELRFGTTRNTKSIENLSCRKSMTGRRRSIAKRRPGTSNPGPTGARAAASCSWRRRVAPRLRFRTKAWSCNFNQGEWQVYAPCTKPYAMTF